MASIVRFPNRQFTFALVASMLLSGSINAEFRDIAGHDNNLANPDWGAAHEQLLRMAPAAYDDGVSASRTLAVSSNPLPSARAVSNGVAAQSGSVPNSIAPITDWFWQWGQFLDHDIDLTDVASPAEPFNIAVPTGDPFFDPMATGTQEIDLNRSVHDSGTGTDIANPREQINQITAYLDGSVIYGSEQARADVLRTMAGDGKLVTSLAANGEILLMKNVPGLENAGGTGASLFLSGDVRANEQIGLTAAHTLFAREHNRQAQQLKDRLDANDAALVDRRDTFLAASPGATEGDFLYQSARKLIGAQMQRITYGDWLPLVLGDGALDPFIGYDDAIDAGIANEFSTAGYRFGHTLLSPQLLRAGDDAVALRDAFFNPAIIDADGVDNLLAGLAMQRAQELDNQVIDDVRNFLFGPPGAGGFDLASLNIQRGRDHGLPDINTVRAFLGLAPHADFDALAGGDVALANALASVYGDIGDVDLWVGGLAEDPVNGGLLGETFHRIVAEQFTRLRDGDRFFYLNPDELSELLVLDSQFLETSLGGIIGFNAEVGVLQDNVFLLAESTPLPGAVILILIGGLAWAANPGRKTRRA